MNMNLIFFFYEFGHIIFAIFCNSGDPVTQVTLRNLGTFIGILFL